MPGKTKEEKIIEDAQLILKEITSESIHTVRVEIEYEKLLNNYLKLNKQFNRILKLGDSSLNSSRKQNKKTINIAREKIIGSMAEQRKLKSQLLIGNPADKKQIKNLSKLLEISMKKIELLESKDK